MTTLQLLENDFTDTNLVITLGIVLVSVLVIGFLTSLLTNNNLTNKVPSNFYNKYNK